MPSNDAVALENWFPFTTSVNLRNGYTQWATGFPSAVQTVMGYQGGTTSKLFGIAGTSIYDATAGGAIGAAAVTGLTNAKWQYVNIATPGGNYLWLCNGADAPYTFDGTTWANPAIAGLTSTQIINVNIHKNRLWAVESGTLKAWYLPVQSIAGTFQALDLSSFCNRGGYLMAMATWTIDAGYGVDDLAVFITSEGEVLVYRGTDPSSATTWALVGVWWLGSPIGRRCYVKFAGDLLLICEDGLLPLSECASAGWAEPGTVRDEYAHQELVQVHRLAGELLGTLQRSNLLRRNDLHRQSLERHYRCWQRDSGQCAAGVQLLRQSSAA
jgi:hypothetical protein